MTELLQHATDDQIALAFCCGALLICSLVMHFSYHLGQSARSQSEAVPNDARRLRVPQPRVAAVSQASSEKAA